MLEQLNLLEKVPYLLWLGRRHTGMMRMNKVGGQGIIEYALILLLVVLSVITVLTVLGPAVGAAFSRVIAAI